MEFSVYGKKYAKKPATNFSSLFNLHCYHQVASIFTLISDYFVNLLLLKCLHSIETKKLLVRIVVPKLQSLILGVTGRDVQLEHCVVPTVPISQQSTKTTWITILLRSTAPQNLKSPLYANFAIKSFQDFTLYVNIETLNTEGRSDQEQEMWMWKYIVGNVEGYSLREELRSCQHFLVDSELERARHKVFNYAVESLNETIVNEKIDHFFKNLKCAAKLNLAFGFLLKNIQDGGFSYFYAHENNTLLDRSKPVCIHDDLAKLKDFLNKTDVIESCSRERMNKKWRF